MGAMPPNLNQAPPLPPNLAPPQQATVLGLAGPQGNDAAQGGSASLQESVIKKMMFIEQTWNDVATIMPSASGVADGQISSMRQKMAPLLASGAQPPGAGQTPGSLLGGGAPMIGQ